MIKILALTLTFLIFTPSWGQASEPRLIGTFGDWRAFSFTENGNKVCYMASQPKTAIGNYTKRGDVFALITHRPAEKTRDVFSYITGYPYKENSEVIVKANNNTFKLFTQDETAWAVDEAGDRALVGAIRAGSNMVIEGESSRGTKTTDTFSLSGSGSAYSKISEECGL